MKKILKMSIGLIGVIIGIIAYSLWKKAEIDWQLVISLIIGGLIGLLIGSGIMMEIKKAKNRSIE